MARNTVALIDESRCIGCTRCIDACPVDAIVGAQSLMHTVIEPGCIGCGLCPPACPVDCIAMVAPRGRWTPLLKRAAGQRARERKKRLSKAVFFSATPERRRRILAEILSKRR